MSSLSVCTAEIANAFPQTCKQNWVLHFPAEIVKTICSVVNLEHCVGRSFNREKEEEEEEIPECLRLHQLVVRRIGEMCRIVNQVKNILFTISITSGPPCSLFWSERPTVSGPSPQILNRCFPLFPIGSGCRLPLARSALARSDLARSDTCTLRHLHAQTLARSDTCTLITCTLITCTLSTCTLSTCTLITCTLSTCTLITCTLRHLHAQTLTRSDTCTLRHLHTQTLAPSDTCTLRHLHAHHLHTQTLARSDTYTLRHLHAQTLAPSDTCALRASASQSAARPFSLFHCLTSLDFLHSAFYCRTCMTVACATLS